MSKTLSIIVPVYNKAQFLRQCLTSIDELKLNHEEVEAIFVDDVSTDGSLEQLKEFERTRDYMRVIELEENSGSPAKPRNVGIEAAEGTYITFLDADDWLDTEGFPKLLNQAVTTQSDIVFGQSLKHKDHAISQIARFSAYTKQEGLVPYEIDKIFRAVGPPGKIIKQSVISEHHIDFEPMKYGEDKLFFTEVIAHAETAAMNDVVVYHVNRYGENQSLVSETDIFEKTDFNLEVLKKLLDLDIPETARKHAISRIVEMDYLSRLFMNRRFLKSTEKAQFYEAFHRLVSTLDERGLAIRDYLTEPKYEKVCACLLSRDHEKVETLITLLSEGIHAPHYIADGLVYYHLPEDLQSIAPLYEPFYAVYNGTHLQNNRFYEAIMLYKADTTEVSAVNLVKLSDESVIQNVPFEQQNNQLWIPSDALNVDFDYNLQVVYDHYKPFLVHMMLPSVVEGHALKRQGQKVEYVAKQPKQTSDTSRDVDTTKYFTECPSKVWAIKKFKVYGDTEFTQEQAHSMEKGEVFNVSEIQYSKKGTPRLVLTDGNLITANKNFVEQLEHDVSEQYIVDLPTKVQVTKKCKAYEDRNFKTEAEVQPKLNDVIEIDKIVCSSRGTPRLKTKSGYFMTANRDFVQVVD
ncbi:DUF5776 domain-containing protein [Staphylococcus simulans]|uniref:DUF5776 domain-containing protein n=1 Tax=Staphylococcus simulans TaxID=1286 RepID=UPI003999C96C